MGSSQVSGSVEHLSCSGALPPALVAPRFLCHRLTLLPQALVAGVVPTAPAASVPEISRSPLGPGA